ncbi:MAG: hypothetical protein ABL886_13710 [Rhodoglobus sp.]
MLLALDGLLRRLEAVAAFAQQARDGLVTDTEAVPIEQLVDSVWVLLLVQRNGDSGSPRVPDSTNSSSAAVSSG